MCAIHKSSCFSRPLRVPIAMRRFYKQTLWILQKVLLTNPDLHHGLLGKNCGFSILENTPPNTKKRREPANTPQRCLSAKSPTL